MFTRRFSSLLVLASAMVLVTTIPGVVHAQPSGRGSPDENYRIELKSRTFIPEPGVDESAIRAGRGPRDDVHFYAQFVDLPDSHRRSQIADGGVDLLQYVAGNTYIAVAAVADLDRLDALEDLRWAGPLAEDDKISPGLRRGEIGKWAQAGRGRIVITAQGHADVPVERVAALVERANGEVVGDASVTSTVTGIIAPGRVRTLAREDAIQFLSVAEPRLDADNNQVRSKLGVDTVRAAPYNLDGDGVTALVFDGGTVDNQHPDFGSRVLQTDGSGTNGHATHVAGILLGDGTNSDGKDSDGTANGGTPGQWAGMAPAARLRSFGHSGGDSLYDDPGDMQADLTAAMRSGIHLANMSMGHPVKELDVDGEPPCDLLGDYSQTAILADRIVRGSISGQQLIWFMSAGNERDRSAKHDASEVCGTHGTINSPKTAKNPIAVGAINVDTGGTMTGFSSWGPTDDGRIKPDVVAPGCATSPYWEDRGDKPARRSGYKAECGTSMASPAAAGVSALVLQQWRRQHGTRSLPASHTVKAILAHTARDKGTAGPDYQFGWGAVRAKDAVDLVVDDDSDPLIHVAQVDQGAQRSWTFNHDSLFRVQVTLAWDDPPATALATKTLINDLDLRLIGPDGTEHKPYVLDPSKPSDAATRGNDSRNNVEMVVGDATPGTWTVRVKGTAVPQGPQQFTLITPEAAVQNRPPVADAGGPYTTDEGVNATLDAGGSSDPDGDTLTYQWDLDNDGDFDDATGRTATFDRVGFRGSNPVGVKVTDAKGAFDIDTTSVTVRNVAPGIDTIVTNSPIDEGEELTISGSASDPGWLTDLKVSVDWGDPEFPGEALSGTQESERPDATFSFAGGKVYGDNGTFTVKVCADDGLAKVCDSVDIQVGNVAPAPEIDTGNATDVNGAATLFGRVGELLTAGGNVTDPGSDDLLLTWVWGDGDATSTNYLVNPPSADPLPSPSLQPRNVDDTKSHPYTDACFYTLTLQARDDDADTGSDEVAVVMVGDADRARSAGYWLANYRGAGTAEFDEATLRCYLDIVGHVSLVFHDVRDAATIEKAAGVLHPKNASGDMRNQLDRQLLALWLNFANGSIGYDELVDTTGDGTADTELSEVLASAEAARLEPGATTAELEHHKDVLERINLKDQ